MIIPTGVLTVALALLAAQGPSAATGNKRKHQRQGAAASGGPAITEKRGPAISRAGAPSVTKKTDKKSDRKADNKTDRRTDKRAEWKVEAAAVNEVPIPRADEIPLAGGEGGASTGTVTKVAKTKVYTFGAMDVEGKLKTPQLLYFLNRVKLELEMSAPDHRSFMKELERTADDPNL